MASSSDTGLSGAVKLVYGLYLASLIVGITVIIGVVIAHVKQPEARGTKYESHFRNQIISFWVGLAVIIVGWMLTVVLVGYAVILGAWIWILYRTIRGLLRILDDRAYA